MSDDDTEDTDEESPFLQEGNDSTPFERLRHLNERLRHVNERLTQSHDRVVKRIAESQSKTPPSLSNRVFQFLAIGVMVLTLVNENRTNNLVLINALSVYALVSLAFDWWVFPKVKAWSWALRAAMTLHTPLELRYEPLSCTVRWFGFSPHWNIYTRYIENESNPEMVAMWSRIRSEDLSARDIIFLTERFVVVVLSVGLVYFSIWTKGVSRNVWVVISFVFLMSFEHIEAVVNLLILAVRCVKLRRAYNDVGLDELF